MGLTIIAAGTSVPQVVASVIVARKGRLRIDLTFATEQIIKHSTINNSLYRSWHNGDE